MYIYKGTDYPLFIGDIQIMHPEWSEGDPLPTDWELVTQEPVPEITDEQTVVQLPVDLVKGKWVQKWQVRDLTTEELQARTVRAQAIADLQRRGMSLEDATAFASQFVG